FDFAYDKAFAIAAEASAKHERSEKFAALEEELKALFSEEDLEENGDLVHKYFHDVQKEAVRNLILDKGIRLDGRTTTEIRPIWCEVDYLPSTHGSSIFKRCVTMNLYLAQTQSLHQNQAFWLR